MPTYDIIDGIKIDCYSGDHLPPHIHAIYKEHEALIEIKTLAVYRGALPSKQLKKASAYVKENENDLLELFYALNETLRPNATDTKNT